MKTFIILSVAALFFSSALGLTCKMCRHQVAGDKTDAEAQMQGELFGMWDDKCKDGTTTVTEDCDDTDGENSTYKMVCYSMVGKADLSFKQNVTKDDNTTELQEMDSKVDFYFRGCLNVSKDTDESKDIDDSNVQERLFEHRPSYDDTISDVQYTNKEFRDIEICMETTGSCNSVDLEPITGSASLLSATMSLVTMATAVAYWNC